MKELTIEFEKVSLIVFYKTENEEPVQRGIEVLTTSDPYETITNLGLLPVESIGTNMKP